MTELRREVRLPIYWLVIGLLVMVVSPILAIVASVKINNNTIRANERARAETRVESQAVYCRLIGAQTDVYSEAESEVGKAAYTTWLAEYRRAGCKPER